MNNKTYQQKYKNTKHGYVRYNERETKNENLSKLYKIADILGIEHPDIDKEYEKLSVPETLSDMAKSVGVEASHVLVPKDKEKQYDSQTKAGEISKYAYRHGIKLLPVIAFAKNIGKISKSGKLFEIFEKIKANKIKSKVEKFRKDNPFSSITLKVKSAPKSKPVSLENKPNQINSKPENNIPKTKEDVLEGKKTDFEQLTETKPDTNKFRQAEKAEKKREKLEKQERDIKEMLEKPEQKNYKAILPENTLNPTQLSSADIKSLTDYHKSIGEVFDKNNSDMISSTLNSPEYKEIQRLSKYDYSPVKTSELFTRVNGIDFKNYSKNGVTAYDTLYNNLSKTTIFGKTMKEALQELVSSEEYQNLPDYIPDIQQDSKVTVMNDIFINYANHTRLRLIKNEPDYIDKTGLTLGEAQERMLFARRQKRLEDRIKNNSELMKSFV